MECGEARPAQAAGLKGFDEGGSLLGGVAEPAAAVGFQDGVMGSSHNPPRYDCYATLRPESSDGASDSPYTKLITKLRQSAERRWHS